MFFMNDLFCGKIFACVFFDTIVLCTITPAWKYAMQFCEVENDEE